MRRQTIGGGFPFAHLPVENVVIVIFEKKMNKSSPQTNTKHQKKS
jgi:hypothetical protein